MGGFMCQGGDAFTIELLASHTSPPSHTFIGDLFATNHDGCDYWLSERHWYVSSCRRHSLSIMIRYGIFQLPLLANLLPIT